MAEALCGPSNALKSFSGHVEQDRSVQQDRAGPSSQPQVDQFRTTHPNASRTHDARFHAALNGGPVAFSDFRHGAEMLRHAPSPASTRQHGMTLSPPAAQHGAAAVPDWAAQFQQMNLNPHPAPPVFTSQGPLDQVQAPPISQPAPAPALAIEQQPWHSPSLLPPFMPMSDSQSLFAAQDAEFSASMDEWMAQHGPRAEAAIDAEMESLARELEAQEAVQDISEPQDEGSGEPLAVQEPAIEAFREPEAQLEDDKSAAENADELAAAARRIVEVMDTSHTSDKMKNSGFLSLMRRLADGDVKLQDQEFVDEQGAKVNVANARIVDNGTNSQDERLESPKWTPVDLTKPFGEN